MTKKAFTLIELMIVVSIMIFLASLAVPKLFRYSEKAKQAEVAMMLASLHTAQQMYYAEHGTYSADLKKLGWKPDQKSHYTYGFYFPGAQETKHFYLGKLNTPSQALGMCHADEKGFVARAAGRIGNKIDLWQIDETRNIVHPVGGIIPQPPNKK